MVQAPAPCRSSITPNLGMSPLRKRWSWLKGRPAGRMWSLEGANAGRLREARRPLDIYRAHRAASRTSSRAGELFAVDISRRGARASRTLGSERITRTSTAAHQRGVSAASCTSTGTYARGHGRATTCSTSLGMGSTTGCRWSQEPSATRGARGRQPVLRRLLPRGAGVDGPLSVGFGSTDRRCRNAAKPLGVLTHR
jgi:hypothetical protein